ncbi:cell wall metabolism sensor histidine kinase WalK [candidate division KSB1 bacterium]|nr:cell wall metabolism sensor histidine kinase WalK [candidate division KSB1 bacterium]NIR70920.1 cell wall metabolism sensor histidine kinase WalK [candidate division KSB1 bacterium]NIS23092.1 cell wall metabolism sensor histidine kinase WalK [candidate division KSB1 bacterium]NIT69927.1 cell wall metabolism sensor histidine kinase WalK [candidate division KSB1 bacterium]NIU23593.1 cell wall metabolism sensor histidine kinase WalK [candidate division KSB1 bacterium]
MRFPEFIGNSIFKKLMFLIFVVASVPIGFSLIYFIYLGNGEAQSADSNLSLVYYGLFLLTILAAALGAYVFSKKISRPITHFIESAREIARGNFSHKVSVESRDEIGRLAKIFNYMTTELRRLDEMNLNKIINEKNKTETILRNIADGVIVTDPENRILLINSVAERWFGITVTNVEDKPCEEFVRDRKLIQFIQDISSNGERNSENIEVTLKPNDGFTEVVLQARAARILSEKDDLVGVVTVLRDITREKEIDRMKTELVSMVAHELRSPLTCISGFSELLLDDTINREQSEEYASIILKETNRLSELINKFLDISKIESGRSQVQRTPVDLKMLIEKVVDFNGQLAEKKKIAVKLETPQEVSLIQADRDMMEQVFLNLFSNAVKYSPENANVTIRIHENDDEMTVEVEDTGYGISEKALPHIFDKFYRITDNEEVSEVTGSGLGLSLVKQIIEIHGGKIKVQSKLGEGSNFIVTLPKADQILEEQPEEELVL